MKLPEGKDKSKIAIIKQYLKDYNYIKSQIEQDEITKEYCYGLQGLSYDGVSTDKSNEFYSDVENQFMKKDALESRIRRNKICIRRIDAAVMTLNDIERTIIIDFHIEKRNWYSVSEKVNISEQQCRRIRDNALEKMKISMYGPVFINGQ